MAEYFQLIIRGTLVFAMRQKNASGIEDSDESENHDILIPNFTVMPSTLALLFLRYRSKDNGLKD